MDSAEARKWLDSEWEDVLSDAELAPDPEMDRLIDSSVVSIRYAVVTQMLGKIADSTRSLLFLQSGTGEKGAWNARSFCDSVIVPWVAENHDVIGTSAEPVCEQAISSVFGGGGQALVEAVLQVPDPHAYQCSGDARLVGGNSVGSSGGFRPMVVAAALMEVAGKGFGLFSRVDSQGVNEADAASGVPGDVMCYAADDSVVMAVEVKDRNLTLADVRSSTRKAQQAD